MSNERRIWIKDCLAIATMDDAGTEYRGEGVLLRGQTIEAVGPAVADALAQDDRVDETIDGRDMVGQLCVILMFLLRVISDVCLHVVV